MSKEYDNTNRGALFKNDDKESDKHQDYKGQINVGGVDYWLSAWLKTSAKGQKYMSLSVTPKDKNAGFAKPQREAIRRQPGDDDSDLPF